MDYVIFDIGVGFFCENMKFIGVVDECMIIIIFEFIFIIDVYVLVKVMYGQENVIFFWMVVNCVENEQELEQVVDKIVGVVKCFL